MVDISDRVQIIKALVDDGKYFTINRARQYGKTTTLKQLRNALLDEYIVLDLSFEGITNAGFQTEDEFVKTFANLCLDRKEFGGVDIPEQTTNVLLGFTEQTSKKYRLDELYRAFRRWIVSSSKPIVLFIDEVDSATNNQVFLDFLGLLRDGYISREADGIPAFQSVILAGVTDVKHLKRKIRGEDEHKVNSPWNIAADFDLDMSLSEDGIRGMLEEYDADHHMEMNTAEMAKLIRDYTGGYPFLVSCLCKYMDEQYLGAAGNDAWTRTGMDEAVKAVLADDNTLFQSFTGKLTNYPELKSSLRKILMEGTRLSYNTDQESIAQMAMYGFIRNDGGSVRIANRIFETRLYNLFLSDEELKENRFWQEGDLAKNIFVKDGRLNMRLIMEHFINTFNQVYGPLSERFYEKDGRELFLLYLKPIINGTGNYYIEAQTRDQKRTDVIVDYLGQQYIIELKIWHGERYNEEGEKQISEYLDYWNLDTGYMLSFNFNKKKEQGVTRVQIGEKVLFEGVV